MFGPSKLQPLAVAEAIGSNILKHKSLIESKLVNLILDFKTPVVHRFMLNLIYLYFTIKNLLKKGWGFNPHMAVMTYAISKSLIFCLHKPGRRTPSWKKAQKKSNFIYGRRMASNFGHRSCRSKIFRYGRRLWPTVQHWYIVCHRLHTA